MSSTISNGPWASSSAQSQAVLASSAASTTGKQTSATSNFAATLQALLPRAAGQAGPTIAPVQDPRPTDPRGGGSGRGESSGLQRHHGIGNWTTPLPVLGEGGVSGAPAGAAGGIVTTTLGGGSGGISATPSQAAGNLATTPASTS